MLQRSRSEVLNVTPVVIVSKCLAVDPLIHFQSSAGLTTHSAAICVICRANTPQDRKCASKLTTEDSREVSICRQITETQTDTNSLDTREQASAQKRPQAFFSNIDFKYFLC